MNVPTKDFKFMIFIKRDNKLITNKNTLAEFKKANDYLKKFDNKNSSSTGSVETDLSRKHNYKGKRTGLNLTPEKFAHIEILRELGINYKYLDEDFTTK